MSDKRPSPPTGRFAAGDQHMSGSQAIPMGEGKDGGRAQGTGGGATTFPPARPLPPPAPDRLRSGQFLEAEPLCGSVGAGEIACRVAISADAPALAAFAARTFVETFGHLYPPADLAAFLAEKYGAAIQRQEIEGNACRTWLAERAGALLGYAQAGPVDMGVAHAERDLELHRLYVADEVKGAGIAQALMQGVLDWARAQTAEALWLSVWENNDRAQAFYRRYGFTHVSEHKFMVGKTADRDFVWRLAL